jgi:zinc protease
MLLKPAFRGEDFARIKNQMLEGLVYQHQKPVWMASQATRQVLFSGTVYERSSDGTEKSVEGLTLDDVKEFYKKHYTPQGAQIVVVGDISPRQVKQELDFIAHWKGEPAPLLRPQVVKAKPKQTIYLVDKPGAPQSIVRMVRKGLPFEGTGEGYLTELANFNLAGNFNSRLNQNLREDKAYTYGATGYLASSREVGAIIFSAQVRANATIPSIIEMRKELEQYAQTGMTDGEVQFMRLAIGQQDALKYETPSQKANLLSGILSYGLDEDYLQQRNQIVETIDKSELNGLASKWFDPNDYQIIVVGDVKSLRPQLESLHIPIEELEIIR